jgi:hypothetical protein
MSRRELQRVTRAAFGLTAGFAAFASAAFAAESGDTLFRTVLAAPDGVAQIVARLTQEPATGQLLALSLSALVLGAVSLRSLRTARVRADERAEARAPVPRRRQ